MIDIMENKKQYTMAEWEQLIAEERAKEQTIKKKTSNDNVVKYEISRGDLE